MIRARAAAVFPGKQKAGIALATFDNRTLTNASVGNIPVTTIEGVIRRFDPDIVVIEPERTGKLEASPFRIPEDARIHFARPSWRDRTIALPEWRSKLGFLGNNAWKLLWDFVLQSQTLSVARIRPVRYSGHWLQEHGKHE